MTNYLKILALLLLLITNFSCKRERLCRCTSPSLAVAVHYKATIAEADKKCAEYEQELRQSGDPDMVCSLKPQTF